MNKQYNLNGIEESDRVTVLVDKSGRKVKLKGEVVWGSKYAYLFHDDDNFPKSDCGIYGKPYKFNKRIGGNSLDKDIYWIEKHSFEEPDETELYPFDPAKAMEGKLIQTKDGRPVKILTVEGGDKAYPVVGSMGRLIITYTINGKIENEVDDQLDLFMVEE